MPPDNNPFVGPRPFEADDARFFFGRDAEVEDLLGLILSNQVVLLYAASGAGKSSLLNVAVVRRLERDEHFDVLPIVRVRGVSEAVLEEKNVFVAAVLSRLSGDGSSAGCLHEHLGERPRGESGRVRGAAGARDRPVRGDLHRLPGALGRSCGILQRPRGSTPRRPTTPRGALIARGLPRAARPIRKAAA